ncbi:Polyphosphate kinase [Hymenobacter roseosalivarius DSM 11622]|uniref:Polyphosphate kinase n=1 Tax=Hymenobacter roseosalivarius DSM 11622 TaxID=645990 RepID=A0A1W1VPK2_9BACT|nr:polyphosphate kinase 1 [Hymenobacter roseosalivarius]SMB95287.1 Polyphosphate kinase [Hymenobacter roseosalivarius DSM 11622]
MEMPPKTHPTLLNRELSWLAFNARVLQEAQSPEVPLLERLKFMAIFSSNLDEYFKVRVATLRRLVKLKKKTRAKLGEELGEEPAEQLKNLLAEVNKQQEAFGDTFRGSILPELHRQHIHLLSDHDLSETQLEWVGEYFRENVRDLLSPVILDDNLHHLFLKDQSVYLTFLLTEPVKEKKHQPDERVLVIELPTKRHGGRFVQLPAEGEDRYVLFLDDVIRCCATELFPQYQRVQVHAIKISRDAELDIQEEVSGNLMAKIKSSLQKRETGYPARLLYDPAMPHEVLRTVMQKTGIGKSELVAGSRYHNFRDFFGFPDVGRPDLTYPAQPPLPHPTLPRGAGSMLAAIAERDHLLHLPYQSFEYVTRFLTEAALDPAVTSIGATLYRVSAKSEVAKALVKAAKQGKQVTVVVELKARFDEESNMYWAEKLQKAGANVIFGIPDLKVHSKLALVTRTENEQAKQYAYLSTGNFNEVTSQIYADHGLFTADERLTGEVSRVFDYFLDRQPKEDFEYLLVAPFELRDRLNELVDREIKLAKAGKEAYIILKVNALQDDRMIHKLYEASAAGVRVELLVRGISCLIPQVAGQSENIEQRGLVDRYLEHARVYVFGNDGDEKVFVASSDWMARNLDRRVEVGFPILDPKIRAEVRHLLDLQRQDNVKSRDFYNNFIGQDDKKAPQVRAQLATYEYLKKLSKARTAEKAPTKPASKKAPRKKPTA